MLLQHMASRTLVTAAPFNGTCVRLNGECIYDRDGEMGEGEWPAAHKSDGILIAGFCGDFEGGAKHT